MKTEEQTIKIHEKTLNQFYRIAVELNKELVNAVISEMIKHNSEATLKIIEDIRGQKEKDARLYNLKDLSKVLNIPYNTIVRYRLPYRTIGNNPRKMYNIHEVKEYLKI